MPEFYEMQRNADVDPIGSVLHKCCGHCKEDVHAPHSEGCDLGGAVCEHFVGRREWGIGPTEPWRKCVKCGWSKAQHELPSCTGAVSIKGQHFSCELNWPHEGWGHSNSEAQAVWSGPECKTPGAKNG